MTLAAFALMIGAAVPAGTTSGGATMELPHQVGEWRRGATERYGAEGLFGYMDGAGELYLAYRFDHLDVTEYAADGAPVITVELYWMATSDDAFGLLSGDWSGNAAALSGTEGGWPPRALYGAGLLRLWAGELYARILAEDETAASREAVLALGRAIVAGRPAPPAPALLASLPDGAGGLRLRRDRTTFLRSHLVLNSVLFLASRDLLGLGPEVDAVVARYEGGPRPAWLVLVSYEDGAAATRALATFREAYLEGARGDVLHLEDGWSAVSRNAQRVAIALACPDSETARTLSRRAAGIGKDAERKDD